MYAAILEHYGVIADPARIGDSNRKETLENAVKHTQDTGLKGRKFEHIEAQNEWLMHWEERWAALRIHGRSKRQVEEMFKEEKPYLSQLPLTSFKFFKQEKRTVYDDGTIQVANCYYAANPAPLFSTVIVRVYDREIEILEPVRMEVIRQHPMGKWSGSLIMEPADRIFNPSRETDRLLAQAELIGPNTFSWCEKWFNEEGRSGQRRMYGFLNLVRHYSACYVEKASELAKSNGLRSCKAVRRIVESLAAEADERKAELATGLTQEHSLIRSGQDYASFWDQYAAYTPLKTGKKTIASKRETIGREQLSQIWIQADWLRVIEVFSLAVDDKRRSRDDEIWLKSPFTQEEKASMHVSLSKNIYKNFSSGKGGGIMQFCRDMLQLQGRQMSMFEAGQWMLSEAILKANQQKEHYKTVCLKRNPEIKIDLRPYMRPDHPELYRRGISDATCHYLGCGFLPPRGLSKSSLPLNGRIVFQIRGTKENGHQFQPVILSHSGRALNLQQQRFDGKYWSYPFRKGLEI